MSAERRFGVTLLVSLALWVPTLQGLLANNVSLATAFIRYAVGLGLAWLAVAGADKLLSGYRDENLVRRQMSRMRRSTDFVPEIDDPLPLDAPADEPE